jgi:hypothetical protein
MMPENGSSDKTAADLTEETKAELKVDEAEIDKAITRSPAAGKSADGCCCEQLCECLLRFYEILSQKPQPTLGRAELYTATGDGDNKDHDTGIFVSVKTADDSMLLASISNADSSGKDMTEYNDDSYHIVPLVVESPGATDLQCTGFKVHMWIKTNGDDTWDIDLARVTLYFSDGTNLVAEQQGFQLVNDGASTDFSNP